MLTALAACGSDGSTGPKTSGFDVVAGGGTTDTVGAKQLQALVITVRDAHGHAAPAGTVVNFLVAPPADSLRRNERGIFICPLSSVDCGDNAIYFFGYGYGYGGEVAMSDTTDARGQAKVQVAFGTIAGKAEVVVSIPEYGAKDSVAYTVKPGSASRVRIVTRDTLLTVGAHFTEHATTVDRFGNARTENATFVASSSGSVTTDAAGVVTAVGYGRSPVIARYNALADTAYVSVPPIGRFVAYAASFDGTSGYSIVMMNLDGTYRRRVTGSLGQDAAFPDLSPDHQRVTFVDRENYASGPSIYVVDSSGNNRKQVATGSVFSPTFSADGSTIYYAMNGAYPDGVGLWRVGVDGTGATKLWSGGSYSGGGSFAVSPDGKKALYMNGSLTLIDLVAGTSKVSPVSGVTYARFKADGSIVYSSYYPGTLFTLSADGTTSRPVPTGNQSVEPYFGLSPDGAWVLTGSSYGYGSMLVVNVATGATIALNLRASLYEPSWR